MAEENLDQGQEQDAGDAPSAEVVREARALGWAPKERWRGNPEDWLDAGAFLEKGKELLPVLKANNQQLLSEMEGLRERDQQTVAELRRTQAALKALEDAHEETQAEAIEDQISMVKAQIAEASRNGEHEQVAELTEKLTDLKLEAKKPPAKTNGDGRGTGDEPSAEAIAELRGWFRDNPDYKTGRKAALANAISAELRQKGDRRVGAEFLDAVKEEVEATLGETPGAGASKALSGNGGTSRRGGGGEGRGKGYAELPADAKSYCERVANRFVGEGKRYKDIQSWRNNYAKKYFEQEA
jgi:hypothetical protein